MLRCYYVGREARVDVMLDVTRVIGVQGRPIGFDGIVVQYFTEEEAVKIFDVIKDKVQDSKDLGEIPLTKVDDINGGFIFVDIGNVKDYFNIN